mgnify:CR=1 FL=1
MRAKPNFVEKIPEQFFKEQDFLLRIFEKIDNKELSLQILTSLPTVINEVLNTTPLKIGDYYKFFSNAFSNMNLSEKLETGKKENIKKTKNGIKMDDYNDLKINPDLFATYYNPDEQDDPLNFKEIYSGIYWWISSYKRIIK